MLLSLSSDEILWNGQENSGQIHIARNNGKLLIEIVFDLGSIKMVHKLFVDQSGGYLIKKNRCTRYSLQDEKKTVQLVDNIMKLISDIKMVRLVCLEI